jgi:hypothetical protein
VECGRWSVIEAGFLSRKRESHGHALWSTAGTALRDNQGGKIGLYPRPCLNGPSGLTMVSIKVPANAIARLGGWIVSVRRRPPSGWRGGSCSDLVLGRLDSVQ